MRVLTVVLSLFLGTLLVMGCVKTPSVSMLYTPQVCFRTTCRDVELATTSEQRRRGLMFREQLPVGSGMLFVFEQPGTYRFWMKNTLIPLDMLRLDSSGVVLHIASGVSPCTVDPCPSYGPTSGTDTRYVLEVGSGVTAAEGINPGDTITFFFE